MNRNIINKNLDVFNYWLSGGKVSYKRPDLVWVIDAIELDWNDDYHYIKCDEFIEFGKALVDGKDIYSKVRHGYNYIQSDDSYDWELDLSGEFHHGVEFYHIGKPNNLDVKVGDILRHKINKSTGIVSKYVKGSDVCYVDGKKFNVSELEKWYPEENEYCMFYNKEDDSFTIKQYHNTVDCDNIFPVSSDVAWYVYRLRNLL